ncbi:hypothetical protein [Salinigranum halophilum]|uniref:hypothetical protein n=1 Tax=Salinigranum halophilum TaxID=2565931 RepID=UPI00115E0031|nr:hypothetical protein [Salinigranum halophilum]
MSHQRTTRKEVNEDTPRLVTKDGTTLTFYRLWVCKNGWVAAIVDEDSEELRRYPPHQVKYVEETYGDS